MLVAEIPLARAGHVFAAAGYAAATVVWLTFLAQARLRAPVIGAGSLLLVALVLRLPFFFVDPVLSGDVYRYRWDGRVTTSGTSPYAKAPAAEELAHLRDDLHGAINHPDIPTIYPPLAQALFWVWGMTNAGIWLWRLILVAADLAIVGLSGRRLGLFWATCPLVILEGTWSGHIEILVAAALLGACSAVVNRQEVLGGFLAALAIGLKVTPVAALPVLVAGARRRLAAVATIATGVVVPVLPFVGRGPIMPGLREYAVRWEFNGIFYESLKWIVEVTRFDAGLKALFTWVKNPLGVEPIAAFVYSHLYPAWIARALCVIPLAGLLVVATRRPTLAGRVAWSVAALLLASPTVHPWYWLALLPLAAAASEKGLLSLAIASPLSYVWYVDAAGSEGVALLLCYMMPMGLWWLMTKWASGRPEAQTSR
jgi:hypothetical protein